MALPLRARRPPALVLALLLTTATLPTATLAHGADPVRTTFLPACTSPSISVADFLAANAPPGGTEYDNQTLLGYQYQNQEWFHSLNDLHCLPRGGFDPYATRTWKYPVTTLTSTAHKLAWKDGVSQAFTVSMTGQSFSGGPAFVNSDFHYNGPFTFQPDWGNFVVGYSGHTGYREQSSPGKFPYGFFQNISNGPFNMKMQGDCTGKTSCTYVVSFAWDQPGPADYVQSLYNLYKDLGFRIFIGFPWSTPGGTCGFIQFPPPTPCSLTSGWAADEFELVPSNLPQPPTAAFTSTKTATPGQYHFVSNSTTPNTNDVLDYKWTFGDGPESATGATTVHRFTKPGTYSVTLKVTNSHGQSDSVTKKVTVKAPTLAVALSFPGQTVAQFDSGATIPVRVTVSASANGVGDLSGLSFTGGKLVTGTPSGHLALTSGPTPSVPSAWTLAPGDSETFNASLKALADGAATVSSQVTGKDAAGKLVDSGLVSRNLMVGQSLIVKITTDPAKIVQPEDAKGPKPVKVAVTIKLTNPTGSEITNLNLRSLNAQRSASGQLLAIKQTGGVSPDPIGGLPLAPLAAHGTRTLTANFLATDDGETDFSALATGAVNNRTIRGFGKTRLSIQPKYLVHITSRVATPAGSALLPAGSVIKIEGTVKNLSNTATLDLGPLFAGEQGNAGPEGLAYDGVGVDPRSQTPPKALTLDPGSSTSFTLKVLTSYSDPRVQGRVARTGGTRAVLTFTPWGTATLEDGTKVRILDSEIQTTEEDLVHNVSIDDSIEIPPSDPLGVGGGIMVGAVQGIANFAAGALWGLVEFVKLPYTAAVATAEFQSKVWATLTPQERDAFGQDVAQTAMIVLSRNAKLGLESAATLWKQANATALSSMTKLENEWQTGDYATTAQTYSAFGSDAIASVVVPIALAKLSKSPRAIAALAKFQEAIQTRMAPLLQGLATVKRIDELAPILEAIASGTELTGEQTAALFGISPEELAQLQELATKYKFLLTVRSRAASSLDWIKKFGALLKPEAFKIKSVSALDERLGYPSGKEGSLVFKKPEPLIAWQRDGGSLGTAVNDFVQSKGFVPGTAEWEDAVFRIAQRMDEWTKWEKSYKAWSKQGFVDVSFNWDGNAVNLGNTGTGRVITTVDGRRVTVGNGKFLGFRLRPTGQPEEFIVELLNGKTGKWVPVTGDIDPIAFTHLDGSPLNATEHALLLEDMRTNPLLQSQHGESATYVKGGVDFVLGQFKPNEPGLQIAPGGAAPRVVRLVPDKSRWASPFDYNLHWDGGFVDTGLPQLPEGAGPRPNFSAIGAQSRTPAPAVSAGVQALPQGSGPTVGLCTTQASDTGSGTPTVLGPNGQLMTVNGTTLTPADASCFSAGAPVTLVVTPSTTVSKNTPAGASELPIAGSSTSFAVGDQVAIGPGTGHAETATISGFGSLIFTRPLSVAHPAGDVVVVIRSAHAGKAPASAVKATRHKAGRGGQPIVAFVALAFILLVGAGGVSLLARRRRA